MLSSLSLLALCFRVVFYWALSFRPASAPSSVLRPDCIQAVLPVQAACYELFHHVLVIPKSLQVASLSGGGLHPGKSCPYTALPLQR